MSYEDELPIYDENETCSKCGFDRIKDEYQPKGHRYQYLAVGVGTFIDKTTYEAIKRTCLRCGFTWINKPLDVKVSTNDSPSDD